MAWSASSAFEGIELDAECECDLRSGGDDPHVAEGGIERHQEAEDLFGGHPDLEGESDLEHVRGGSRVSGDEGRNVGQGVGLRVEAGSLEIVQPGLEERFEGSG